MQGGSFPSLFLLILFDVLCHHGTRTDGSMFGKFYFQEVFQS